VLHTSLTLPARRGDTEIRAPATLAATSSALLATSSAGAAAECSDVTIVEVTGAEAAEGLDAEP
jgi:hypothetical protein